MTPASIVMLLDEEMLHQLTLAVRPRFGRRSVAMLAASAQARAWPGARDGRRAMTFFDRRPCHCPSSTIRDRSGVPQACARASSDRAPRSIEGRRRGKNRQLATRRVALARCHESSPWPWPAPMVAGLSMASRAAPPLKSRGAPRPDNRENGAGVTATARGSADGRGN